MSNGRTHRTAGAIAGGAIAAYNARDQGLFYGLLETLGGVLAGIPGAATLDWLEPATSPRHRDFAHSVTFAGLTATASGEFAPKMRDWLREKSSEFEIKGRAHHDPLIGFLLCVAAVLCRMAAGAVSGFLGGHASHYALDLTTPSSLPLLTAGF